jgi:hypothetical protein
MSERRTAYLLLLAMAVCFGGTWPADIPLVLALGATAVAAKTAPAGQQLAAD